MIRRLPIAALALTLALAGCTGASTPAAGPTTEPPAASASTTATTTATTGSPQPAASASTGKPGSTATPFTTPTKVSHLFFHSLVVDTDRAFDPAKPDSVGFEQYMVTVKEFNAILESLHAKGYVLVQPHRLAKLNDDGVMEAQTLRLPAGKKPLILSVDDVSYNKPTVGAGFADRLTLDDDGKVTNDYTDAAGKTVQGAYDVPTVVDAFVAQHPDFSYEGDKGIVALTGYEGVLGYRSSTIVYGDNDKTDAEIEKATAVADAMKEAGWTFANHSYGHRNFTTKSLKDIKSDTEQWLKDVAPIVGDTDQMIYAFGADIADGNTHYTDDNEKYAYLKSQGFDYFFNVDASQPYWAQLDPGSYRGARINVDGITLSRAIDGKPSVLHEFFDPKAIIDPARHLPTPGA